MRKQEIISHLQHHLWTRLAATAHGVGVVAIRDIPKGTMPFEGNRFTASENYIGISDEELADLEPAVKQYVKDFFPYQAQEGGYQFPDYPPQQIDQSYYLNHSKEPNMGEVAGGEDFVALRDIKAGEELTVDYATYDDKGLE